LDERSTIQSPTGTSSIRHSPAAFVTAKRGLPASPTMVCARVEENCNVTMPEIVPVGTRSRRTVVVSPPTTATGPPTSTVIAAERWCGAEPETM